MKAADCGLMHSGIRLVCCCSRMNLCSFSETETIGNKSQEERQEAEKYTQIQTGTLNFRLLLVKEHLYEWHTQHLDMGLPEGGINKQTERPW